MRGTLEILKDAYEIVRDPKRWTTRAAARNSAGYETLPWGDFGAVRFCAAGAIWKASRRNWLEAAGPEVDGAFNALTSALGGTAIPVVNDGPDGHALICAGFRKAIADLTPRETCEPVGEEVLV